MTLSSQNSAAYAAIKRATYLSLTTLRKNGHPVPTPVWFAEVDGQLFVETAHESGKIKRIHNNASVIIAPCTATGKLTGAPLDAEAHLITDAGLLKTAEDALARKYNILRRLYYFGMNTSLRLRGRPPEKTVFLVIRPGSD